MKNTSHPLSFVSIFLVVSGLSVGTVLWVFGSEEKTQESGRPAPNLSVDKAPVQGSSSPEVVSYADMLEKATPSVVGVVTTQVVSMRQRGPMSMEDLYRYFHGLPPRQREGEETHDHTERDERLREGTPGDG